jgi:hypothetical protein
VTPRQILQVAIQTAASRGFHLRSWWEHYMAGSVPPTPRTAAGMLLRQHDWLKLVFSYAFARALFGDEARDDPEGSLPDWQYHLRELAALGVEDERLAYLAGYLRRC